MLLIHRLRSSSATQPHEQLPSGNLYPVQVLARGDPFLRSAPVGAEVLPYCRVQTPHSEIAGSSELGCTAGSIMWLLFWRVQNTVCYLVSTLVIRIAAEGAV
jgi:hypothetical protein